MSTAIICLIIIVLMVIGIKSYAKKLTSGCCGASSGKAPKKIKVADKDISHYPYRKLLKVDGMVCGHCAVNVENSLNRLDGIWARVNLEKGEADVYMKTDVADQQLKEAVRAAGYTVYRVEEKLSGDQKQTAG
mgnify:CR=1 FL=1